MNQPSETTAKQVSLRVLMTPERWVETGRILLTGLIAFLYWRQWVPIELLWAAVAIDLYPLVKTVCSTWCVSAKLAPKFS